ncbi:MAG TPA: glutamine--fructose-6-phosphate transaminase (isomerizing), partial [Clostridia bacterium]|nr:glutamine--fructose-6-phosphate transaminase (isomerizing) [Clostridia bacterium]
LQAEAPLPGCLGIGHTRWATHGPPSDENSHPHSDQSGSIAIVHNGVIENYEVLKQRLTAAGHSFKSSTDTEVLAHLIGEQYQRATESGRVVDHPLTQAVIGALAEVTGTYGIAVISTNHPDVIVAARRGSPLIIGLGREEQLLASDASALVAHTRQVVYLNDGEVATITGNQLAIHKLGSGHAQVHVSQLEFSSEAAEKGSYPHYMLKEIFEQPLTVQNALRGRLDYSESMPRFGGLNMTTPELRAIDRVVIAACGTSWHAGLAGEYLIEELAHVPVEVEYASEFRYRNAPFDSNTLLLVITQSGETLDTLAGVREARRRGHKVLAICNVVGSTIAREADGGIYLHAGPEIGVASTKAFTSQVTLLALFALFMGRIRMLAPQDGAHLMRGLEAIPALIRQVLEQSDRIRQIALKYKDSRDFLFLGRQASFPVALEGALKLKEISYIHAEGYPAAEMKHGPIALIDPHTPSVFVAPVDHIYDKTQSNIEEVKARKGPLIAITTEGNTELARKVDDIIYVPPTLDCLTPLLTVIPLQLLAYHIAVARGCDVDKPRNLAKSVTVE